MIRDKDKVYGQVNHPDTVICTETIDNDVVLVGAGNRGVKPFRVPAKSILAANAQGKLTPFSYGTVNKVIGTDSAGNLVLKDMPTPTPVYLKAGSVTTNDANITIGSTTTFGNNCSKTRITSPSMLIDAPSIIVNLANPITITEAGEKIMTLQVGFANTNAGSYKAGSVYAVRLSTANGSQYIDITTKSGDSTSDGCVAFSGKKYMAAGTYTTLGIVCGTMPTGNIPMDLVISGAIFK